MFKMKFSHSTQLVGLLCVFMLCVLPTCMSAKLKTCNKENCEVCVTFLENFQENLDKAISSDPKKIGDAFKDTCRHTKKDDNRFCYYVGGLEDSATSILGEITKRVSWSMPAPKICHYLYLKDEQICDLRYEKQLDLKNVDIKKLKVKDLKKILSDWEEQCKGCTEKSDYVDQVLKLLPKYAPEAAKARQEL